MRIWHHALSVPRIVELDSIATTHDNGLEGCVLLKNKKPPPLLRTCRESRHEALKAYNCAKSALRGDHDIFHLKSCWFYSTKCMVPDFESNKISWDTSGLGQWDSSEGRNRVNSTDKWLEQPDLFRKLRVLAVNIELFGVLRNDFECAIRHFFPNLLALVLLVNDGNITMYPTRDPNQRAWQILRDLSNPEYCSDCIRKSTGSFTTSIQDKQYAEEIRQKTEYHLEAEAEFYENYHTPRVVVMTCQKNSDEGEFYEEF